MEEVEAGGRTQGGNAARPRPQEGRPSGRNSMRPLKVGYRRRLRRTMMKGIGTDIPKGRHR